RSDEDRRSPESRSQGAGDQAGRCNAGCWRNEEGCRQAGREEGQEGQACGKACCSARSRQGRSAEGCRTGQEVIPARGSRYRPSKSRSDQGTDEVPFLMSTKKGGRGLPCFALRAAYLTL